jgi:predicted aspartyl protease
MDSRAAIGRIEARAVVVALALLLARLGSIFAATPATDLPLGTPAPAPTAPLVPDGSAAKPDFEAATRPDRIGRIIVPVMVNHQGPFSFALDTGANRTVLTPQLVVALGLHPDDEAVTIEGATGSAVVPTALVDRVAAGDVVLVGQRLPIADAMITGIDGILGVDGLESKRIAVDFANHRIDIRNARHGSPIRSVKRIPAQLRFGRLIVVDANVDGIQVKAVIDTGSEYTLGNDALRAALELPAAAEVPYAAVDVLGETDALQEGRRQPVQSIKVGDIQATNFNIVFGKFYVFTLWDLDTQPALVIGMDLIGRLDAFVIDYERREVQLRAREYRRHGVGDG